MVTEADNENYYYYFYFLFVIFPTSRAHLTLLCKSATGTVVVDGRMDECLLWRGWWVDGRGTVNGGWFYHKDQPSWGVNVKVGNVNLIFFVHREGDKERADNVVEGRDPRESKGFVVVLRK